MEDASSLELSASSRKCSPFFCLAAGRGLGSPSMYLRLHQLDVVGDNMGIRQSGVRGGAGIQAPRDLHCLALRQGEELVVRDVVPDAD